MTSAGPPKSCLNCPSYLKPQDAVTRFGKAIGAPMCAEYGHVLGRPGAPKVQEEKLAKHYANGCAHYGKNPTPTDPKRTHKVVLPDPDVLTTVVDPGLMELCKTCMSCSNYVRPEKVMEELGWTAGLCSATGDLLMENRLRYVARECDYRQFGTPRATTAGMRLLPEFEDAFNLAVDPIHVYMQQKKSGIVEPGEYPTDREVSEEESRAGIRAWRVIRDPEGSGNEVFLPVYRRDFLTDEQWAKVPKTGDDEHPELYVDHNGALYKVAVCWTELDETPALWGEAGVGKTELFRHVAWLMQLPFERFSITASTELDDLAGKMMYTPGEGTYFQYGRLPLAWQSPAVICLDEPNTGPPEVWQFIRPLTDNSKQLVLDMNKGERIPRHTDAYLGMAMNPAWDIRNVGALDIADADANRLFHIYMELPPEQLEKEIIRNRILLDGWEIDDARLDTIMRIAVDVRGLCREGTLPITWGIRPQIKVARASRWFDLMTAYRVAAGNYLDPAQQEVLMDQIKAHVVS